jgi:hypothetical protein
MHTSGFTCEKCIRDVHGSVGGFLWVFAGKARNDNDSSLTPVEGIRFMYFDCYSDITVFHFCKADRFSTLLSRLECTIADQFCVLGWLSATCIITNKILIGIKNTKSTNETSIGPSSKGQTSAN